MSTILPQPTETTVEVDFNHILGILQSQIADLVVKNAILTAQVESLQSKLEEATSALDEFSRHIEKDAEGKKEKPHGRDQ